MSYAVDARQITPNEQFVPLKVNMQSGLEHEADIVSGFSGMAHKNPEEAADGAVVSRSRPGVELEFNPYVTEQGT